MANKIVMEQKGTVVSEITEKVKESASIIFFDYRGLSVAEVTELRRKLHASGSEIKVYKNTLTSRALDSLNLNLDCLSGPSAMAFSKDQIAPIKILTEYAKTHKALEIKGGIVDGTVANMNSLNDLAVIPSREGLLTMLAGGMIGVVRNLSISLHMLGEQKEQQ